MNDQDFEKYAKLVPDEEKMKYYGYYIEDWKSTEDLVLDLKKEIVPDKQVELNNSVLVYKNIRNQGQLQCLSVSS